MNGRDEKSSFHRAGAVFHDGLADVWSAGYTRRGFKKRGMIFEFILKGLVRSGDLWLDAGCGSGFLSRQLSTLGADVIGVDASTKMIKAAEAETDTTYTNASFLTIDTIEYLPFPEEHFDGILCSSVIEYLEDPAQALGEMFRVMRPGGILLISVPNRFSLIRQSQRAARRVGALLKRDLFGYLAASRCDYGCEEFSRLVESVGFEVDEIAFFDPVLPAISGLSRLNSLLIPTCRKPHTPHHPP